MQEMSFLVVYKNDFWASKRLLWSFLGMPVACSFLCLYKGDLVTTKRVLLSCVLKKVAKEEHALNGLSGLRAAHIRWPKLPSDRPRSLLWEI